MSGDSATQAGDGFEHVTDTPEQADDPFRQSDPWQRGEASQGRRRGEQSSGMGFTPDQPSSSADEDSTKDSSLLDHATAGGASTSTNHP